MSIVIDSRPADENMLYSSMEDPAKDMLNDSKDVSTDSALMEDQMTASNDHLEDGPQAPQHIFVLDRQVSNLGKRDHPPDFRRNSGASTSSMDSNASPRRSSGLKVYGKKKQKLSARQRKRQLERKFGSDFKPGTIRHRLNFLQHSFGDQLALIEESLPKTFFRVMSLETFIKNKMEQHALDESQGSFRRSPGSRRKNKDKLPEVSEMAEIMTFSPLEMPSFSSPGSQTGNSKQVQLKPRSTASSAIPETPYADERVLNFLKQSPPPSPEGEDKEQRVLPAVAALPLPPMEPMLVDEAEDPAGVPPAEDPAQSNASSPTAVAMVSATGIVENVVTSPEKEEEQDMEEEPVATLVPSSEPAPELAEKPLDPATTVSEELELEQKQEEPKVAETEQPPITEEPAPMAVEEQSPAPVEEESLLTQKQPTPESDQQSPQVPEEAAATEIVEDPQKQEEPTTGNAQPQEEDETSEHSEVAGDELLLEKDGDDKNDLSSNFDGPEEGVVVEPPADEPQEEMASKSPSREESGPAISQERIAVANGGVVTPEPVAAADTPESTNEDASAKSAPAMEIDTASAVNENSVAPSTPVGDHNPSPASATLGAPRTPDAVELARMEQATPLKKEKSPEPQVVDSPSTPTPDAVEAARIEQQTPVKRKQVEDPAANKDTATAVVKQQKVTGKAGDENQDTQNCPSPNSVMDTELGDNEEKVEKAIPVKANRKIRFADEEGKPLTKEYLLEKESNYASRIVVMLLSPRDRKFEFLHAEYPLDESTTVQVLLEQVPFLATNDAFRTKRFHALLQTETSRQLDNNLALQDYRFKESEIVLGIPDDFTVASMTKMAVPLLLNKKLMKTVKQAIRKGRGLKTVQSGEDWRK